ncbi:hypothetical protein R5R35_011251 [Gryllus longicercus]|uniref:Odorant binding protein n=1 Tax=Gryllus longicercus TaxID=2509291 RepID=A0AAN9VT21_9ORTH
MEKFLAIVFLCLSAVCRATEPPEIEIKKCTEKYQNAAFDDVKKEPNHDMKCIVQCVMESQEMMSGNKINHDVIMKSLNGGPGWKNEEEFKKDAEKCKNIEPSSDKCETAFKYQKCLMATIAKNIKMPPRSSRSI